MDFESLDPIHRPPVYSAAQLLIYFRRISFPRQYYNLLATPAAPESVDLSSIQPTLPFLTLLVQYHQSSVPFENLSLHYSIHKTISLDVEDLFEKIVTNRRGGYCMECNCFFGTVLRSLGFHIIGAGGRVSGTITGKNRYTGLSHMVNIVTIDDQKYLIDVGFGNDEPCIPIPLIDGTIVDGVGPRRQKIEYKSLSQHTDKSQRAWLYSFEDVNDESEGEAKWVPAYSFHDIEFFPEDFQVMNMSTSTRKTSMFTYAVLCTLPLLNDPTDTDEAPGIMGYLSLFQDGIKKRIGGKVELLEKFESEEDRLAALEKYFGIVLSAKERSAIHGMVSEIKTSNNSRTSSRR